MWTLKILFRHIWLTYLLTVNFFVFPHFSVTQNQNRCHNVFYFISTFKHFDKGNRIWWRQTVDVLETHGDAWRRFVAWQRKKKNCRQSLTPLALWQYFLFSFSHSRVIPCMSKINCCCRWYTCASVSVYRTMVKTKVYLKDYFETC